MKQAQKDAVLACWTCYLLTYLHTYYVAVLGRIARIA